MGTYFQHWLNMPSKLTKSPKIFLVNWFRKNEKGQFMWPGFGDNMRVLEWMLSCIQGTSFGEITPLGLSPRYSDLNWENLNMTPQQFSDLMSIDREQWMNELKLQQEFYSQFGETLPNEFMRQMKGLTAQILNQTNTNVNQDAIL